MALTKAKKGSSIGVDILKAFNIKEVKRVEYFDSRYYKILYEQKKPKKLIEEYLPSVTEILNAYPKDFLARWRGEVGNERADQIVRDALNLGSIVHFGAEVLARGGVVIYNPIANPIYKTTAIAKLEKKYKEVCVVRFPKEYIQLYRIWQLFKILKPTGVQSEQTVFSITHKYAGTTDLLCKIKEGEYMIAGATPLFLEGGIYVCDYKTGKYNSITYEMQLAAYIKAIQESKPKLDIKGGLLIQPNSEKIKLGVPGLKVTLLGMTQVERRFIHFMNTYEVYKIEKPAPTPKEFSFPSLISLEPGRKN